MTLKEKQIHSLDKVKKPKEKNDANDAQREADSLARKRHAKKTQTLQKQKAFVIKEVKLTHRKNGH